MHEKKHPSRREFLVKSALGAAGLFLTTSWLSSCGKEHAKKMGLPPLLDKAPDGRKIKAGLVGCGGRGTGAAIDFLQAGPNLEISAMGDVFSGKLSASRKKIEQQTGQKVAEDTCFLGFDAYKKVIQSQVDVVILATPPYFRPLHFAACVNAHKHVFMEKPLGVDPAGIRSVIASARRADNLGLTVITGTQKHHNKNYLEAYKRIARGDIGSIVAANCYYNMGQLWYKKRKPQWSDMEYMLRDWVNWSWLSGDHITEQHIHSIDAINWFMGGKFPLQATGMGARQQRVTGDQYDQFNVDFVYEANVHLHSMCRQIHGCSNQISEFIRGTEGYSDCRTYIARADGEKTWSQRSSDQEDSKKNNPYVQEHIYLVSSIRKNKPVNVAEFTAKSTLSAIMGRISAYTGKTVTWKDTMNSNLRLGPEGGPEALRSLGPSKLIEAQVPVPGSSA